MSSACKVVIEAAVRKGSRPAVDILAKHGHGRARRPRSSFTCPKTLRPSPSLASDSVPGPARRECRRASTETRFLRGQAPRSSQRITSRPDLLSPLATKVAHARHSLAHSTRPSSSSSSRTRAERASPCPSVRSPDRLLSASSPAHDSGPRAPRPSPPRPPPAPRLHRHRIGGHDHRCSSRCRRSRSSPDRKSVV